TRTINTVKIHADGPRYRLEKRPDFLSSSDPWFRPVAVHVGPDSNVYIVDWYNKIISHNEVPRNHPERDRTRGRVWRVRPSSRPPAAVPDVSRAADLVAHLRAPSTWEGRAAWHQIVDRGAKDLAPALRELAVDDSAPDPARVLAVWSLADLGLEVPEALLRSPHRFLRREAVRARRAPLVDDPDPQVRLASIDVADVDALLRMVRPPGPGAEVTFERSRIRAALEARPAEVRAAKAASPEARALAALAIGDAAGLAAVTLDRPLAPEELELLAGDPAGAEALSRALASPAALRSILPLAGRWKNPDAVAAAARAALKDDPALFLQVAVAFRLAALEQDVAALVDRDRVGVLKALSELGSQRLDLFKRHLHAALPGEAVQREAVAAIAGSKHPKAAAALASAWPQLPGPLRTLAIDRLTSSKAGCESLLAAVQAGELPKAAVDARALGRLKAALGATPALAALESELAALMTPVLRLSGGSVTTGIDLDGPFTVEAWIELAPGITNKDGLLGAPGVADMNFHDGRLRVYLPDVGDVIVASRPVEAETWTHVAVTRSPEGEFRLYVNGVRDPAKGRPDRRPLRGLDLGRTTSGLTEGRFAEFRVWAVERGEREIGETYARGLAEAPGLVRRFSGTSWGSVRGKGAVEGTLDGPPLLTEKEAAALEARFEKVRALATAAGDAARGREIFARTCLTCHKAGGKGVEIGPPLDGAGLAGVEGLLRAILTPSAAVESGYRVLRVETKDGDILDGRLVSQDDSGLVLRIPNREDVRLARAQIGRAAWSRLSLMPEGLLDALKPEEVGDLFAFLLTLK
ncbi:MAG TPA: LamG-like jellyroll fold domain-containing protein, partial [Planctomycetota bacterium]|nr:LamG-like jellyroll fold domain-containing protein [Planctomycetota bacterium]